MSGAPALLIAGTHSGCGKTTLTLGIMAALKQRNIVVRPFKCGPDFIDPSLHEMVTGQVSRNLDVRMCGEDFVRASFARHNPPAPGQASCAVVEGVMGLFDGGEGSAAHLAKTLNIPVILVVDVRSAAESVAAVVNGFTTLDPELQLAGVICNRVGSSRHAELVGTAIRNINQLDIPLLGFFPREETISIPSRHLGLYMGKETPLTDAALGNLVQLVEKHLDVPLLLQLATRGSRINASQTSNMTDRTPAAGPSVRIGLAYDAAFSFYYADNLDLLRQAGAELVPFSPLTDSSLPDRVQGLYLGGGYPELHAEQLANNATMRAAIRRFSEAGGPIYAECGGFMYLCRSLRDLSGATQPMCAVFPFACAMHTTLKGLGYRHLHQNRTTFFGPAHTALAGHEFHYSSLLHSLQNTPHHGQGTPVCAWQVDNGEQEGYLYHNTLASYIHLHWGRSPQAPAAFVQACRFVSLADNH